MQSSFQDICLFLCCANAGLKSKKPSKKLQLSSQITEQKFQQTYGYVETKLTFQGNKSARTSEAKISEKWETTTMSPAVCTFSLERSLASQVQISLKVSKVISIFILLERKQPQFRVCQGKGVLVNTQDFWLGPLKDHSLGIKGNEKYIGLCKDKFIFDLLSFRLG